MRDTYLASTLVFEDFHGNAFVLADELQWPEAEVKPYLGFYECAVLITPLNPRSEGQLSKADDTQRLDQLEQILKDLGYSYATGLGLSADGEHQEAGFIIFNESVADVAKLAEQFQQNAVFAVYEDRIELHGVLVHELSGAKTKKLAKVESVASALLDIIFSSKSE